MAILRCLTWTALLVTAMGLPVSPRDAHEKKIPINPTPISYAPGRPMRWPTGTMEGRSFNTITSGPTNAHTDVPLSDCTTTMAYFGKPCAWDGTSTVYPTIVTAFKEVDCHGCINIHVQRELLNCPEERLEGYKTETTPSTSWSTICALPTGLRDGKILVLPSVTMTVSYKPIPPPRDGDQPPPHFERPEKQGGQ